MTSDDQRQPITVDRLGRQGFLHSPREMADNNLGDEHPRTPLPQLPPNDSSNGDASRAAVHEEEDGPQASDITCVGSSYDNGSSSLPPESDASRQRPNSIDSGNTPRRTGHVAVPRCLSCGKLEPSITCPECLMADVGLAPSQNKPEIPVDSSQFCSYECLGNSPATHKESCIWLSRAPLEQDSEEMRN
jgi:hypothetical protein